MTFRVGQKVVCVDDVPHGKYAPWPVKGGLDGLTKGTVYTIREIGAYCGEPVVWLNEITREIVPGWEKYGEQGFSPARFRPLVERKTDISVFMKMLTPQGVEA